MKLLSLLCFLATSSFFASKMIPAKDVDPSQKELVMKTQPGKPSVSLSGVWVVEKLHHVIFGKYSAYERGKSNTTSIPYDNLRFTFYEDGTGVHVDQYKETYPFQWKFTSADKSTLELTVKGLTYKWDMLFITDKYLFTSANLNIGGDTDNIETFRLVKIGATSSDEPAAPTNCKPDPGIIVRN